METTPREILLFEAEDCKVPFTDWMDSLEGQPIHAKIMARLERVELGNLGNHYGVGEGVFELVMDIGPGYRIYFGQDGKSLIILLIGGTKSSQQADIKTAKGYWRYYNA